MQDIWEQFLVGLKATGPLEFIAVMAGIISVFFSRKENIWVYPTGLVNTLLFIYLSIKGSLFGEASVNFYYTVMSIYGWWMWSRKDDHKKVVLHISPSSGKELLHQFLFFGFFYALIFFVLQFLQKEFAPDAVPWADAFASGTAYTGMWLMARKKIESWYWWIATNLASIPLWFVKGYVFTSIQFVVLLMLAVAGLIEWKRRYRMAACI